MPPEIPEPYNSALQQSHPETVCDLPASSPWELLGRGIARADLGRDTEATADLTAALPVAGSAAAVELALVGMRQGAVQKARAVTEEVIDEAGGQPEVRARALHVHGIACGKLWRNDLALESLMEARQLYGELRNQVAVARINDSLGNVQAALGRLDLACHYFAMSIAEKAQHGDRAGIALSLGNLGRVHLDAGRALEAEECFRSDLALSREIGDEHGVQRMLEDLGRALIEREAYSEAEAHLRECLERSQNSGNARMQVYALKDLARLLWSTQRREEARAALDQATETVGSLEELALPLVLSIAEGQFLLAVDPEEGIRTISHAIRELEPARMPDIEIPARISLVEALFEAGRLTEADECVSLALRVARAHGLERFRPRLNDLMTRLSLHLGAEAEERELFSPGDPDPPEGGYQLIKVLGEGGFGKVVLAFDQLRGRLVAIKMLDLSSTGDVDSRKRLQASAMRELKSASRVKHPGVVQIFAINSRPDGSRWLVEEYVSGGSLRELMQLEDARDPALMLRVLQDVSLALWALHADGVVHRDLKPENVLLREQSLEPVLVDFGLAQLTDHQDELDRARAGTAQYMAPEQVLGHEVDGRADLYALGVIGFEWFASSTPHQLLGNSKDFFADVVNNPAPSLATVLPDAPSGVVRLVDRLLRKSPSERFRDAREASAFIGRLLSQEGCFNPDSELARPCPASPPAAGPSDETVDLGVRDGLRPPGDPNPPARGQL